jgi:hypothetical protein
MRKALIITRMDEIIGKGRISRRELLKKIASAGACVPLAHLSALSEPPALQKQITPSPVPPTNTSFSTADDAFLEELEKANFQYFWGQAHPETGIVQDRCHARSPVTSDLGSIAATGFGLTALCIGEKRGFVLRTEAQSRVLNTLRFLWKKLPNHRGFFYHWGNINTGERIWDSEASSVGSRDLDSPRLRIECRHLCKLLLPDFSGGSQRHRIHKHEM